MSPVDIPWLASNENHSRESSSIPLETFGPPPDYEQRRKRGTAASIHNHYYTQAQTRPWYRRKRFFYPAVGLLAFIAITCAVVLGVVLKLESIKKSNRGEIDNASSTTMLQNPTESTIFAVLSTERPSPTKNTIPTVSPTPSTKHTRTSTTTEVKETATPFAMSDKSQLASLLVKKGDSGQERRLLVLQEDNDDLFVTEWANSTVNHVRVKETLGSSASQPKSGTPLAMEADPSGSIHLFYLSQTNLISHVYETEGGRWKAGDVTDERGSIRTSSSSSLSAAWHKGRRTPELLILAYDNPSQKLQLAVTDSPVDRNAWYIADVTSVAVDSVPGQSNMPCYSLAGDWYSRGLRTDDGELQRLLIGVVEHEQVVPWECTVDFWPPPDIQVQCSKAEKAFIDAKGDGLGLNPIPKQLLWLRNPRQPRGQDEDGSTGEYDFTLLSIDGSDRVRENSVGPGKARDTGPGFRTKSPITAMSATSEELVFISLGKDVQLYKKSGRKWESSELIGLPDGLQT
ncbi:hypothetical protein NOR_03214 [Metarhizium rileyi]|uniref:Fucose-specific lectin n=1 Tax=Metarhizium rileyi (strain RCEF 4871) TaxID=1649241 RepID=A0A167FKY9_METRR|nr:hypothetical protein NOR_03214 [Metarhizium rileyi RCEF 4871]